MGIVQIFKEIRGEIFEIWEFFVAKSIFIATSLLAMYLL
jgi:hypothetical protein